MSGGYYSLIRTASQDEHDLNEYGPWPKSLSGAYTLLHRNWLPGRSSTPPEGFLISSRRLSRGSDSSTSSYSSIIVSRRKNQLFVACCILIGILVSFAIVGAHWDTVEELYYEQFLMPSPGSACLADPSSPDSYVHWNPNADGNRAIYHCISRHVPHRLVESPALPAGSTLRTYRPLPTSCLDSYYTNGSGCTDGYQTSYNIVWTWVNGSDPVIARAKAKALAELEHQSGDFDEQGDVSEEEAEGETSAHLFRAYFRVAPMHVQLDVLHRCFCDRRAGVDFIPADGHGRSLAEILPRLPLGPDPLTRAPDRDHDELRHSLRSVLQYFRESTKKFIILTSDFEFPVSHSPFKYLLGLQKRSHVSGPTHASGVVRKRDVAVEYGDDYEDDDEPFATARLGLLPQWLVFDTGEEYREEPNPEDPVAAAAIKEANERKQRIGRWRDGDVSLEVIHHAEVFDQYDGTVFNSNSIESQLGNIVGDETFIYFNDDCFFSAPLSSSDFHTHNFGLVFRMIAYPFSLVNPHHYPVDSPIGEWHPMEFTNYLISERFGIRRRPYPMHQVKVLQGGLMREMWEMWPIQEALNRGHKFRGLGGLALVPENHTLVDDIDPIDDNPVVDEDDEGAIEVETEEKSEVDENDNELEKRHSFIKRSLSTRSDDAKDTFAGRKVREDPDWEDLKDTTPTPVDDGDAHVMFLFTHFVVERSREGMLWSWIVGSLGGDNDEFEASQRNEAWRVLTEDAGAEELGRGQVEVLVEKRKTMEPWRVQWALDVVGDTLKASRYRFSSQDGYAYSYYDDQTGLEWWHDGSTYWPQLFEDDNFAASAESRPDWSRCTIDWNVCFDSNLTSASDIFKHIAFEHPRCGDCVLKALVRASGDLGLSALLPSSDRFYRPQTQSSPIADIPPHLPLSSEWQHVDFSLAAVFASGFWTSKNGVNLREWVQRVLERYRYVIADTDNSFSVIHDPIDAETAFAFIDDHPKVALVTLNDDLQSYPEQTDRAMREWFQERWPTPAEWENPKLVPTSNAEAGSIPSKRFQHRKL